VEGGRGERRQPARGRKGGRAVGCRLGRRAKYQGRNKKTFSFYFSKFSKAISKKILNPLLNLKPTTQYKNSNATA
jgi:hypothetical protein